jgi:hypothetical protein
MSWQSDHYRKFILLIVIFLGVIYLLTLNPLLGIMGDNAKYIVLAKSIISGNGFRSLNFPDAPPETKYGFGYPVLIAPVVYFFPDNVIALKLVTVFFAVLALLAVFQLFKMYTDLPGAIAVMALSGISCCVVLYAHQVMTEIPYLFFSVIAIYFIEKYGDADSRVNRYLFLGALCLGMSYFIRAIGIFLFIGAFGYLLIKKKAVKAILVLLCFVVLITPWFLRNRAVSGRSSYFDEFMLKDPYDPERGAITLSTVWERVIPRARYYRQQISYLSGHHGQKNWMFALPIVMLGFAVSARKRIRLHHIYVPLYSVVCLFWYWNVPRFVIPAVPFIFYYFLTALVWLCGRRRRAAIVLRNAVILAIFLLNFRMDVMVIKREQREDYYSPQWRNYFQIADWVKENVPGEAVIMCRKPYLFYLRSGRKTALYPFTRDAEKITLSIKDSGADYVVLDAFTWNLEARDFELTRLRDSGSIRVMACCCSLRDGSREGTSERGRIEAFYR